jgi:hypothetical protein
MYRFSLLIIAVAAVALAGWWHGHQTARWGESDELNQAAQRIDRIKSKIGDWEGRSGEIDTKQLKIAEIVNYASRTYINRRTGQQLAILLICGRPGPISVHTPDVCYQGAGYVMGRLVPYALRDAPGLARQPEFWAARFTKEPGPQLLNILWTWSNGGIWQAPEHPRFVFYRSKYLYKLYVIHAVSSTDDPVVDETTHAFLREFLPELNAALSESAVAN